MLYRGVFNMIVKLIIHKNEQEISIWNEAGDRLYYSDKEKDVKLSKDLLLVIKKDDVLIKDAKTQAPTEQRMHGYFNAYWLKGIVQLKKRAEGYVW